MSALKGSINSKGTWLPTSGNATLDQFEINAEELGKINLTAAIDGYDLSFVEALQKTQENMAKADAEKTQLASLFSVSLNS